MLEYIKGSEKMNSEFIIFLLAIIGIIIIIVLLMIQIKKNGNLKEEIKATKQIQEEQLKEFKYNMNQELFSFSSLLRNDFNLLNENTTNHLVLMEKNVKENMSNNYESTSEMITRMLKQMAKIDESQENLKLLSTSIQHLQNVLTDKKTRGIYGEIELYSILDAAMLDHSARYEKQAKLSNGTMVDALLYIGKDQEKLCIDSKFPLENYNRMVDTTLGQKEQQQAKQIFISDVKKHIKAIADKYIIPNETSDFAFMFLPAEAIFAYIYANFQEVVDYSYKEKVFIVSPTTIMAYMTAIKAIYLREKRNEHIHEIEAELQKLAIEFDRFVKRYNTVQNDFEKNYQDMKNLDITARKIQKRFSQISDVELEDET